jgi:hypothetical protein
MFPDGWLQPGMLVISVDGHAFGTLHPETDKGRMGDQLPTEIFRAMHDGKTMRIEYLEQGAKSRWSENNP